MKTIFLVILMCFMTNAFSQDQKKSVNTQITVQQYEDGKIDDSRFFIFYFNNIDGYCDVMSVTVTNTSCKKDSSPGPDKSFWIKPEYSSKSYSGNKFQCKLSRISKDSYQFVIEDPITNGTLIHRLILKDSPIQMTEILDYSGVMSKFSTVTNKTETVTYRPVISKSGYGWSSYKMGCDTMSIPVMVK